MRQCTLRLWFAIVATIYAILFPIVQPGYAEEAAFEQPVEVQFRFERAPWRTVLDWLAREARLALHVDDLPTGSFTYHDAKLRTLDEAIDRINLFLIPKRYTLVRTDELLSVINLDNERSLRQLDTMARMVDVDELDSLGSHDVVQCLVPLGQASTDASLKELAGLLLLRDPVVMPASNQLLVTETAGKMRTVVRIVQQLSSPDQANARVRVFPLGELDVERVLAHIRPHLGLAPLAMTGVDISISVDSESKQILATGSQEHLNAIAGVMNILQSAAPIHVEEQLFRTHDLGEADMQTVVHVLETLLSGEDARLAPDSASNQLAVLGSDAVHQTVQESIRQLAGDNALEFKTIELKSIEPKYALHVLREMFGLAETNGDGSPPQSLKIEADPFGRRLFVRARPIQLTQIGRAIAQLEAPLSDASSGVRLLPFKGERAREILGLAEDFWPHQDVLEIVRPTSDVHLDPVEREVGQEVEAQAPQRNTVRLPNPGSSVQFVAKRQLNNHSTKNLSENPSPPAPLPAGGARGASFRIGSKPSAAARIRAQWTPQGILVHSDNAEALQRFEDHLQTIAGRPNSNSNQLAIFYLKHAQVEDANELLRRILEAEHSDPYAFANMGWSPTGAPIADTLDVANLGASSLDDLWSLGPVTVVPDARLNRMFVYCPHQDLEAIEKHLAFIDRETSVADIKTNGTPKVLELRHARAEDVARIIRDVYAGRIAATSRQRQQAFQQRQQSAKNQSQDQTVNFVPQNLFAETQGRQPKLTVAVSEKGNALVITAPKQLALEVERLARELDEQSQETVFVGTLRTGNQEVYQAISRLVDSSKTGRPK